MENLNFVLKCSLKEMAMRKLVINLCIQTDILSLFESLELKHQINYPDVINRRLKVILLELKLPESLTKCVIDIFSPISLDLLRWKRHHVNIVGVDLNVNILKKLHWTSTVLVDYKKSAEELVHSELLSVKSRYELACLYCLADCIPALWEQVTRLENLYMNPFSYNFSGGEITLEYYWFRVMKEKNESRFNDIILRLGGPERTYYQHAFEDLASKFNKGATEFFFQKLKNEERAPSLYRAVKGIVQGLHMQSSGFSWSFPDERVFDVLNFVLSRMCPEQQLQVLKEHPCEILCCFLEWPCYDLFLEVADKVWTFLPESEYGHLAWILMERFRSSYISFRIVFQRFFERSPNQFKRHFVKPDFVFCFFSRVLYTQDTATMKIIFQNITEEDRLNFLSCYNFFKLIDRLIIWDKWDLVKPCFQEAMLSKESRDRLEEKILSYIIGVDASKTRLMKRQWRRFFQFIDQNDKSTSNKRKSEDETPFKKAVRIDAQLSINAFGER